MAEKLIRVLWDEESVHSSLYRELVQGIRRSAAKSQYALDIHHSADTLLAGAGREKIIIVVGYETPRLQKSISSILDSGRQVLLAGLDGERFGNQISSVSPSRSQATAQLLQYLLDCGRKSIAMVGCDKMSLNDMVRCDTMKTILRSNGYANPDNNIFYFYKDLYESFDSFSLRRNEFDAVMCPNDYTALCFLRYCQDNGIRVPEDIYLTAFSNSQVSQYSKPSITTTAIDFYSVGEYTFFAWQFLQSHAREKLHFQLTTPSKLLIRETTCFELEETHLEDRTLLYDTTHEGGAFYADQTIQAVLRIENCLAACNPLDLQIIRAILNGESYESISERLFISHSGLHYHLRRIFPAARVNNRKEFERLFRQYFTHGNNIGTATPPKKD